MNEYIISLIFIRMENIVLISVTITVLYCIIKFLEMKYIEKEIKPVKLVVRDAIIVLFSTIVVQFIFANIDTNISEFFNIITNSKSIEPIAPMVFNDNPGF